MEFKFKQDDPGREYITSIHELSESDSSLLDKLITSIGKEAHDHVFNNGDFGVEFTLDDKGLPALMIYWKGVNLAFYHKKFLLSEMIKTLREDSDIIDLDPDKKVEALDRYKKFAKTLLKEVEKLSKDKEFMS